MPFRLLAGVCIVLALSACSKVKENLKPVELVDIETTQELRTDWSRDVGDGQDARYERLQPLVRGEIVYAVDINGKLSAMDLAKGKVLWHKDLDTSIGGGVGYADGLLLVGTLKGEVVALAEADGAEQWRTLVSSEIVSTPSGNGEVVIAKAIDGRVFALNASDGEIRWNYDHPVPVLTLRAQGSPVVVDENAYIPFDNGQILAFNSNTGQLRWSARVGQPKGKTEIERLVDVDTTPIISGPFVYGAGYQSRIVAINRGTGRLNWAQDNSTYHPIAEGEGRLVTVDNDSHIKVYDAATGTLQWENSMLHRRELSPPGIVDGTVVVSDYKGYVHAIDLTTGEFVARKDLNLDLVYAAPVTVEDSILVLDKAGKLLRLSLRDKGEKASKTEVSAKTTSVGKGHR